MSLELIVIVIVILVVATVVLSIFGGQLANITPMVDNRANCINTATASCRALDAMPPTWSTQPLKYYEEMKTCAQITGKTKCEEIISTTTKPPPTRTLNQQCTDRGTEYYCDDKCDNNKGDLFIGFWCDGGLKCCKTPKNP